jgi:hypothetical protein
MKTAVEYLTHIIRAVWCIHVERTDGGTDMALQIESADGTRAILLLRGPASRRPGGCGQHEAHAWRLVAREIARNTASGPGSLSRGGGGGRRGGGGVVPEGI